MVAPLVAAALISAAPAVLKGLGDAFGSKSSPDTGKWSPRYYESYKQEAKAAGVPENELMSFNEFMTHINVDNYDGSYKALMGPLLQSQRDKKKIEGLIAESEKLGNEGLSKFKSERASRRMALANLLKEKGDYAFSENTPAIYEDLSARGLLHSTGAGEALAKERGRIERETGFQLQGQELADLDAEQQIANAIIERTLNLKTNGLERDFSLDDVRMMNQNAVDLATKASQTAEAGRENDLMSSILNTGTTLGTAYLTGGFGSPSLAKSTAPTYLPKMNSQSGVTLENMLPNYYQRRKLNLSGME